MSHKNSFLFLRCFAVVKLYSSLDVSLKVIPNALCKFTFYLLTYLLTRSLESSAGKPRALKFECDGKLIHFFHVLYAVMLIIRGGLGRGLEALAAAWTRSRCLIM